MLRIYIYASTSTSTSLPRDVATGNRAMSVYRAVDHHTIEVIREKGFPRRVGRGRVSLRRAEYHMPR